jgi:Tfp pilus assembly protein PilN
MSQQINLFNPIFRKQGFSFTSATAMLYGIGIAIAAAALVAVYQDSRLRDVQTRAQAVEQAHKDATARQAKLAAELAQQKPNAQLTAESARLEAQLKGRQEITATLKSGAVGNTRGFSEYMRAFSRQNVNGLWLTGFDIALAGNELAIQGRTLSADLVATYLRRLNQEQALQGRQFAAMRISQPPPEPEKQPKAEQKADQGAKGQQDVKEQKVALPHYLDFNISTVETPESSPGAAQTVPVQPPLLGVIDLNSVLEPAQSGANREAAR